jgi:hypothetical protein
MGTPNGGNGCLFFPCLAGDLMSPQFYSNASHPGRPSGPVSVQVSLVVSLGSGPDSYRLQAKTLERESLHLSDFGGRYATPAGIDRTVIHTEPTNMGQKITIHTFRGETFQVSLRKNLLTDNVTVAVLPSEPANHEQLHLFEFECQGSAEAAELWQLIKSAATMASHIEAGGEVEIRRA